MKNASLSLITVILFTALAFAGPTQAAAAADIEKSLESIAEHAEGTAEHAVDQLERTAEHFEEGQEVHTDVGHDDNAHSDDAHGAHEARELVTPIGPTLFFEMIWSIVVFAIFFVIMSMVVWPKVLGALQAREQKQQADFETARKASEQASSNLDGYKAELANAQRDAQRIIDEATAKAAHRDAEMKAKALEEVNAMRVQAMQEIQQARQEALAELNTQAAAMASSVAGKIMKRPVDAVAQQPLVDQVLSQRTDNH